MMQLPRGTFREIRKNVAIESLLYELNGEKFSGVASISSQSRTGTLVFKEGKCILVKIQNCRGDEGWDEIQKAGDVEVDAALSVLGDAQIDLALEFNKPCRILKTGKFAPAQVSARPMSTVTNEHPRTAMAQKAAVPVAPLKSPVKPAPTHHHVPAPASVAPQTQMHAPPHSSLFSKTAAPVPPSPAVPTPVHADSRKDEADVPPESDQEISSFESDLDTFDTMDFENVTDKIRTDCKTMIKQLHLDHLMER
jgi:hypothetical protein